MQPSNQHVAARRIPPVICSEWWSARTYLPGPVSTRQPIKTARLAASLPARPDDIILLAPDMSVSGSSLDENARLM